MAFSQEIRFKIGADTTELKKGMQSAGAVAQATGKKIDDVMKGSFADARRLADFREKQAYKEASTVGKLKMLTAEVARNVKDRNKFEQGSSEYLKRQLAIEEKVTKLRQLQRIAAKERMTASPAAGQQAGASPGAVPNLGQIGEGLIKRTIWLGAGTLFSTLINAIPTFFQRRAQQAERQEDVTGTTGSSLQKTIETIGGLQAKVRMGRKEFRDLGTDIAKVQKDIEDLTSGPYGATMDLVNPLWQSQVEKLRDKLAELQKEQTQVGNETQLANRALERQSLILENEKMRIEALGKLNEQGRANPINLAKDAASAARLQVATLQVTKGTPEEIAQARNQAQQRENELAATIINERQRVRDMTRDFTAQAAQGRTFDNGRPRARSESERLAQQAERARERARGAVLTGAAGEAAMQTARARRLEVGVTSRLSEASSQIEKQGGTDLGAVKAELTTVNQILTSIRDSLYTVEVK